MTEGSSEASRWKLASFLLAGVLIPIVVALLPWALDKWIPKDALEYTVIGPISVKKAISVSVQVKNLGRERQSNVEIWLPLDAQPDFQTETDKNGMPTIAEKKPATILDSSITPVKTEKKNKFTVLYYSNLRPDESVTVTAFVIGGTFLDSYALNDLRVVSDDTIATKRESDDEFDFIFKAATAVLFLFLLFFIIYGTYYEMFMPIAKKRAELQKQLDKLGGT